MTTKTPSRAVKGYASRDLGVAIAERRARKKKRADLAKPSAPPASSTTAALSASNTRLFAANKALDRAEPAARASAASTCYGFRKSGTSLGAMTLGQAKGRRVLAVTGRDSERFGSFTTGERFTIVGKNAGGWTLEDGHGRRVREVPSVCLQVLEEDA